MKRAKKIFGVLSAITLTAPIFAFDWPQSETSSDSFFSYFGQLRGGTIESSLIFMDNSEIKAADDGNILAVITEHSDDFGWFESPLGNAVLIAHEDNLVSVYANLEEDTLSDYLKDGDEISTGTIIGISGNSGWQEGQSCLEFQVLDTKAQAALNPRVLMPRIGNEKPLVVGELSLDDKRGGTHYLLNERYLPAGSYSIYRSRENVCVPYRTIVAINGATVERIDYDMLKEKNGRLYVQGNSSYPVETLYPDKKRQLLGQIQLTRGHTTLDVTIFDIQGSIRTIRYNLEIN